jgi:hypothetical protein
MGVPLYYVCSMFQIYNILETVSISSMISRGGEDLTHVGGLEGPVLDHLMVQ